ncbi:ROK family protein [Brachybacterium sp. AOP42-E1-35]|uniref:ROK family protein n=1 Tax=Brachybacterium sp. AOP42-E1-35 TaxID=3457664 RepID=UPI00402AC539
MANETTTALPARDQPPSPRTRGAVALAIDIGGTKAELSLTDSTTVLGSARLSTRAFQRDGLTAAILRTARDLLREHAPWGALAHCAIARPGAVEGPGATVSLSPNVPGWSDLEIDELLRNELGALRVSFANDAQAASRAEGELGALAGIGIGCYVNVGTGISAGIVVDGKVLQGAHGVAGEIAYLPIALGLLGGADPGADLAPLEALVGGAGLEGQVARLMPEATSIDDVFRSGTPIATIIVHEFAAALSFAVGTICAVVDPQRIAFGGGIIGAVDVWGPLVEANLQRTVPRPPELVRARFAEGAALQGALLLAREGLA